jgi:DNA-binding transcriptional LysR family regulator
MDRLKQLETFIAVAARGSLSAAAKQEGVAAAIIGRRLDALEERLGVRLLIRTTRRISLTPEGTAFLEDCQRLIADLQNAEASVSLGGQSPTGHLRITAPAGFGRKHIAPLVPLYLQQYPDITITLDLSDRLVDIVNEGFDIAIRIGHLDDSSLIGVRLAENRRMVVASPLYLQRAGTPTHPSELTRHSCLTFGSAGNQARGWLFASDGQQQAVRVGGALECNDGAVLHAWALQGLGLAWRSEWEVNEDLHAQRLVSVLQNYAVHDNSIFAVFARRKHLALRVRSFIDFMKVHLPAFASSSHEHCK